jgi:hypothetical protein
MTDARELKTANETLDLKKGVVARRDSFLIK